MLSKLSYALLLRLHINCARFNVVEIPVLLSLFVYYFILGACEYQLLICRYFILI